MNEEQQITIDVASDWKPDQLLDHEYVFHFRALNNRKARGSHKDIQAATVAFVKHPSEDKAFYHGVSLCSVSDQFSRKRGRTIALGRARQAMVHKYHWDMFKMTEKQADQFRKTMRQWACELISSRSLGEGMVPLGAQKGKVHDE